MSKKPQNIDTSAGHVEGVDVSDNSQAVGWVPEPACAVEDNNGKHCPNNPEIWANLKSTGEEVWLCKQCHRNAMERGQLEERKW